MSEPHISRNGAVPEYYFEQRCYIQECWNSPADEAVSVARARVEPGVTTRWHRLAGTTERYIVLEGRGRVEVGEAATEEVGPGDVVLIPPDTRQRIANIGADRLVFLAVCTPRFHSDNYQELD